MGKEDVNDTAALVLCNTFDLVNVMKFRTSTLLLSLNFSPDIRGEKKGNVQATCLYIAQGGQSLAVNLQHSLS